MAGKIQNEDLKTAAELVSAGGTAAQLPNDTKIYVTANGINDTLYNAIVNQQLGGGGSQVNQFYNSNFDIWQGTSSFLLSTPASGTYASDGCKVLYDGTIGTFTVSRTNFTVGQTAVPNEPTYYQTWSQTVAGSGSTFRTLQFSLPNSRAFAGQNVSVSIWLRADSSRTVGVRMIQNFGTGGSSQVNVTTQNASVTTTWTKFSFTFAMPSVSGKTISGVSDDYIAMELLLPLNTTMTIDMAQRMMNGGSSVGTWNYASTGSPLFDFSQELWLCQEFYWTTYNYGVAPGTATQTGSITDIDASTFILGGRDFPRTMWKVPTMTYYAAQSGTVSSATRNSNSADASINSSIDSKRGFTYLVVGSQNNPGDAYMYHAVADARI